MRALPDDLTAPWLDETELRVKAPPFAERRLKLLRHPREIFRVDQLRYSIQLFWHWETQYVLRARRIGDLMRLRIVLPGVNICRLGGEAQPLLSFTQRILCAHLLGQIAHDL